MCAEKISNAGLRVLELLKTLVHKPLSIAELLVVIEETSSEVYRPEVINKYLNTLKILGLEIIKTKEKYYLQYGIEKINFDETDLSLILFLRKYINKLQHESLKNNIFEAFQYFEKGFSAQTLDIIKEKKITPYKPGKQITIKDENVRKFDKYCKDHLRIEITYRVNKNISEEFFKISPLNIIYKKGKALLIAYDCESNEYKEFIIQNITDSTQTPQRVSPAFSSPVTFKIKGRLANAYKLKKEEKVLQEGNGWKIVSNTIEDRDMLLRRLLRYNTQCEILYPNSCRKKILSLIDEMEKIYAG